MSNNVYFFTHPKHAYTIGILLEGFECAINKRLYLLSYDDLFRIERFEPGAFVFTDFDRLTHDQLCKLRVFARRLQTSRPGFPILNHPDHVLGRFDLLNHLPSLGLGHTAAHRLSNWQSVQEFPVFIRHERGHSLPVTDLIKTRSQLETAAGNLLANEVCFDDLIVVKFLEYSDRDGIYRKYGAVNISGFIYVEHLYFNDQWITKSGLSTEGNEAFNIESKNYRNQNPHREEIHKFFRASCIDYGRLDYCLIGGKINAFEINTNPTLIAEPPTQFDRFDRHHYAKLHDDALMKIPQAQGQEFTVPEDLKEPNGETTTVSAADFGARAIMKKRIKRRRNRLIRKGMIQSVRDHFARKGG